MDLSSPEWLVRAAALPGGAQEVEGPRGVTGRYHAQTPASISSNHSTIRDRQTPSCLRRLSNRSYHLLTHAGFLQNLMMLRLRRKLC